MLGGAIVPDDQAEFYCLSTVEGTKIMSGGHVILWGITLCDHILRLNVGNFRKPIRQDDKGHEGLGHVCRKE